VFAVVLWCNRFSNA